jgi:hypothetical protein
MEPAAPCTLNSIIVTLTGLSGTCSLRIFGHEAGTSFPQLEKDLIDPIPISKANTGIEVIQIDLDTPLYIPNNQFFIGFADISGLRIASDNVNHGTTCSSGSGGDYYYQFMKDNSGSWFLGNRAFKVEAIVDYESTTSPHDLINFTTIAGIDSTHSNKSIAWGDINNDDELDLLVAGNLYTNQNGVFTNITSTSGVTAGLSIQGNALVDMNNDGWLDQVWFLTQDTIVIYENNQNETFTEHMITGLSGYRGFRGLSSFSFADINNDKYPDVFVGRLWTEYPSGGPDQVPNYLFENDQNWGLTDNTTAIYSMSWQHRRSRGSQWVDFDDDADLDLYVTNYYLERDELWRNNGNGTFTEIISSKGIDINATSSNHGTGVDWADYDNDGDMDLLLPQFAHPGFQLQYDHRGTTIYRNEGPPAYNFTDTKDNNGIRFEETHAGGCWGDVNNDGYPDIYMSTYYGCRYVDIYDQQTDHSFALNTFQYGIHNIVSGEDGTWVDYDMDGRLDLAAGKSGKIRLWKNEGDYWSNYLQLDLVSTSGNHFAIGARAWVYAGGKSFMQEVSVGRGQRMQNPTRLHFGLGTASNIDSVVIRWPNGTQTREVFSGLIPNHLYRITEGGIIVDLATHIDRIDDKTFLQVYPNPFNDHVNFRFSTPEPVHVTITLYSVIGVAQHTVTQVIPAGNANIMVSKKELLETSAPGVAFYSVAVNGVYRYSGKLINLR